MIDAYTVYCQWCKDYGQQPPTREWWDRFSGPMFENVTLRKSNIHKFVNAGISRGIDRNREPV